MKNWLDKYSEEVPKAQKGKQVTASRADSLAVLNSQLKLNKFYDNEVKHKRLKKTTSLFPHDTDLKFLNKANLSFYREQILNRDQKKRLSGENTNLYDDKYKKFFNLNSDQVSKLEMQGIAKTKSSTNNKAYYRDLITPMQNLASPFALIDSRIKPQGVAWYSPKDIGYPGGEVNVYDYDPLAVTPFDLLSDADKKLRVKKYGNSGVPQSYFNNNNLKKLDKSKEIKSNSKKTNYEPQISPIPSFNGKRQTPVEFKQAFNNIDIPVQDTLVPTHIPSSYKIGYDAPNLAGGQMPIQEQYLDGRTVDSKGLQQVIQHKNNYNNYIENKYGNEEALKNPKAVERLKKLKQSIDITPQYKEGGNISTDPRKNKKIDYFEKEKKALKEKSKSVRDNIQKPNLPSEKFIKDNTLIDHGAYQTDNKGTVVVKNDKDYYAPLKSGVKKATLAQDTRSKELKDNLQQYNEAIKNPSVVDRMAFVGELPLNYLEDPTKILGDLGVKSMPNSSGDFNSFVEEVNNPYPSGNVLQRGLERLLPKVPGAGLNLALASIGSNSLGATLAEAYNPLPGFDIRHSFGYKRTPVTGPNFFRVAGDDMDITMPVNGKNINGIDDSVALNQNYQNPSFKNLFNDKDIYREVSDGEKWIKDWYAHPETKIKMTAYDNLEDPLDFDSVNKLWVANNNLSDYQPKNYIDLVKDRGLKEAIKKGHNSVGIAFGTPDSIYVNDFMHFGDKQAKESTRVHELTHLAEQNGQMFNDRDTNALSAPMYPTIVGDRKSEYYTKPTEIHARMNEARYNFGLTPADVFTQNHFDEISKKNKWFGMEKYIKDKPKFIELMNDFYTPAAMLGASQFLDKKEPSSNQKFREGGVIRDDRGQWEHPGEITEIGSPSITMKNVSYPVLGISDNGHVQMMLPENDYEYNGNTVTELPLNQGSKKHLSNKSKSSNFTKKSTGWLSKYE